MNYKILETNKERGWVRLLVTFEDGSTYEKRMMAPMESEESIHGAIMQWLADYLPLRAEMSKFNPEVLTHKVTTFTASDLPKPTSYQQESISASLLP